MSKAGRSRGPASCPEGCADMRAHVFHLLDGRLTAARKREVARHMKECPACFSRAEFARIMRHVLKKRVLAEPCPSGLLSKIRGLIDCECAKAPARGRLRYSKA